MGPYLERIAAVVIGAGQAGLSASHELTGRGVEHVVLERGVLGDTWRTRRWRSFHIVSPNSLNLLPGYEYDGPEPDAFLDTDGLLAYLESYAASFAAPIRGEAPVGEVCPAEGGGFLVRTPHSEIHARHVIVATGAFGNAHTPVLAANLPASIQSLHTDDYWAPEDLPPGGVLVIGSGQSGLQIATELANAGREVTVAIGKHGWVPRRVYGLDQMRWRWDIGDYHTIVADPDQPKADYPFTYLARWGDSDFNVRTAWQSGARLAGHVVGVDGTRVTFANDLEALLRAGDHEARTFVTRIRDIARARGENAPEPEFESHWRDGEIPEAPGTLDLASAGIRTVIWSTGYRQDFSWIRVPGALAASGAPYQRQGVSPAPGIYFVGLHRMWEAGSGTLLGCGWAATNVAEHVAARVRASG
ncbi:MAG TPA: NAD(P)/FAD-dependent oxidoreductase [Candidatus Saccharimonadaceae bacterium]|nr:NAD(P)/FAD-dependent oxidoreductase [Candidatus Saccharimonadaceae bacterium]